MFDFLKNKDAEKLNEYLTEGAFIVDVRTPEEFAEGSAADAVNIPLQVLEENFDEFKGKDRIVVFCRSGNRSGQAKQKLKAQGFENVVNGGRWQDVAEAQQKLDSDCNSEE